MILCIIYKWPFIFVRQNIFSDHLKKKKKNHITVCSTLNFSYLSSQTLKLPFPFFDFVVKYNPATSLWDSLLCLSLPPLLSVSLLSHRYASWRQEWAPSINIVCLAVWYRSLQAPNQISVCVCKWGCLDACESICGNLKAKHIIFWMLNTFWLNN